MQTQESILCPNCGEAAKEDVTAEFCSLAAEQVEKLSDITFDVLLKVCTSKSELLRYAKIRENMGYEADGMIPCGHCRQNKVVKVPGTLIHIETIYVNGRPKFLETHKCSSCETLYRFDNSIFNKRIRRVK